MAWTRAQIEKSLAVWQERETRFRRNWRSKKKGDPRRFFWFKRLKNAVRMVDRREDQLRDLGVRGVSAAGVNLVKEFEGFHETRPGKPNTAHPYRDPVGIWTIGYGETRGISRFTQPWSRDKASAALRRRLDRDFFPAVQALPITDMTQNEADALTSFAYNLGAGIFARGTSIGEAVRAKNWRVATAEAILLYDKAGRPPRVLPGLTRRRRAERALFLKK